MKLKKWELALIAAVVITLLCGASLSKEQQDLSDRLIRLHVVANSDSDSDQALKLKVRDTILARVTPLLDGVTDREEARQIIQSHLNDIVQCAKAEIAAEGYFYDVTASIKTEDFPTREYDTFSLPAGEYLALRVVIGAGAGHNWWCVIFPPLCTSSVTDSEAMQLIPEDEMQLITSDKPQYVIKFKSIELWDKFIASLKASK